MIDHDLEENVEDDDQAWMLTEWIRYVTDESSGILERPTLGQHWSTVLEQAEHSRIPSRSRELRDVVGHWIGYFGEIGYRLRLLGIHVVPKLSKKEKIDPDALVRRLSDQCAKDGCLSADWKVAAPIGAIRCLMRLGRRKIHYSFAVNEFDGKSAASRVMAWISQFDRSRAPEDLQVTISWRGQRAKTSLLLREIEGTLPLQKLLMAQGIDRSSIPSSLAFEWVTPLPRKRGQQGVAHLEAVTAGMVRFYEDVAAGLRSVQRMPRPRASQPVPSEERQEQPTPGEMLPEAASTVPMEEQVASTSVIPADPATFTNP